MNPKIFKAYDIRGIYPSELNEEVMVPVIRSIYEFFKRTLGKSQVSIVLGRDMRVSSPALYEVAKKTLVASGAHVVEIGLSPTPTFYFAVLHYGYDAGIDITASHNPKEWAGIKFVRRDGDKIIKIGKATGMDEISQMAQENKFPDYSNDGKVTTIDTALDDEVEAALKDIDVSQIKRFKIAADTANGMGSLYIRALFKKIPANLTFINEELDGTFPAHQADPLDFNNLKPLQDLALKEKADFGIEPDGDGDRIFFIDEKGQVVPATAISALIAKEVLDKNPGQKIVVDIRYTRNVEHVVKKHGGTSLISRVGHAFITEDVNREGAYFAGESSGHFYFGQTGGAESAVRVILYVIEALSKSGKPLSALLADLRTSYESGELNFVLPASNPAKDLMEQLAKEHETADISWLDGVSVDYPDWRFNIRASNTEPLLRLNVEADNHKLMQEKFEELTARILKTGATQKTSGH